MYQEQEHIDKYYQITEHNSLQLHALRNSLLSWVSKIISDRAFPVTAVHACNRLPTEIKQLHCISTFRHKIKTMLFQSSYRGVRADSVMLLQSSSKLCNKNTVTMTNYSQQISSWFSKLNRIWFLVSQKQQSLNTSNDFSHSVNANQQFVDAIVDITVYVIIKPKEVNRYVEIFLYDNQIVCILTQQKTCMHLFVSKKTVKIIQSWPEKLAG